MKDLNKDRELLDGISKGNSGFVVPDRYFEQLPYTVNAKKEVRKTKLTYGVWSAAVIAICSVVLLIFVFDGGEEQVDYYTEVLPADAFNEEEYLDQELSEEDLIDFLLNDDQEFNE